jgi:nucleoside-triphosphatase THEP1
MPWMDVRLNWKGESLVQFSPDSPDSLLANFHSIKNHGDLVFISGPSGSGKTYWCQKLVDLAFARGIQPCGLISPAVIVRGSKVGIDLVDITTGKKLRLAEKRRVSARGKNPPGIFTHDWLFKPSVLEWGNQILVSLPESFPLLILDELGPLEFLQNQGLTAGMGLIDRKGYQLACVVVRPELLSHAQVRWPWGRLLRRDYRTAMPGET